MSYNDLIDIIRETNRPPGGLRSLIRVAQRTMMGSNSNVLEIGTATGFSAIELCRATRARITAIDLNEGSLSEATRRADQLGLLPLIKFEKNDATKLPYSDNIFDVVLCGNVTSLIEDRERALLEYVRVLKRDGYLVAMPMYYLRQPPEKLVREVGAAIHVDLKVHFRDSWVNFFSQAPLTMLDSEEFAFDNLDDNTVEVFVAKMLAKPHLSCLNAEVYQALNSAYSSMMKLFRHNLSYMGFSILYLRQDYDHVDGELFTSHPVHS